MTDQRERSIEIPFGQCVAQIENDAFARQRHELADKIDIHLALFPEEDIDLFQFVLDLARVAAGKKDEELERVVRKLELSLFRPHLDHFGRFLFPTASTGIELVENLKLRALGQRFVE